MPTFTIPVRLDGPILWRLSDQADRAGTTVPELIAEIVANSQAADVKVLRPATRVELDQQIVARHLQGFDNAEIARALGTTRELVRRYLKDHGLRSAGRNQRKAVIR